MEPHHIFYIVWVIMMIVILTLLYRKGKSALQIFPDIKTVNIRFREKRASGRVLESGFLGGAKAENILDVIITDDELWIKSHPIFAGVGTIVSRIKLNQITEVKRIDKKVISIIYKSHSIPKTIFLELKKVEVFFNLIRKSEMDLI